MSAVKTRKRVIVRCHGVDKLEIMVMTCRSETTASNLLERWQRDDDMQTCFREQARVCGDGDDDGDRQ